MIDLKVFFVICGLGTAFYFIQKWIFLIEEKFFYSQLPNLKEEILSKREKFQRIPKFFWIGGVSFFILALLDPHDQIEKHDYFSPPSEGLAIYFVLDRSGSMGTKTSTGAIRLDILKQIVGEWIGRDTKNLIGLIAFARKADLLSPLTADKEYLEKQLNQLQLVKNKAEEGTAIGYAIYRTAHLIALSRDYEKLLGKQKLTVPYEIKSGVMILITDGLQDPNILDRGDQYRSMELIEAAAYAKQENIAVYIVNVEPRLQDKAFELNKKEMERAAELTGGKLFVASQLNELKKALEEIKDLEMSRIASLENELKVEKISFYPFLITLGLAFIGLSSFLQSTVWRKVI